MLRKRHKYRDWVYKLGRENQGTETLEETHVERLGLQAWKREPRSRDPGGDTSREIGGDTSREIGFTSLDERTKEQRPWRRHK